MGTLPLVPLVPLVPLTRYTIVLLLVKHTHTPHNKPTGGALGVVFLTASLSRVNVGRMKTRRFCFVFFLNIYSLARAVICLGWPVAIFLLPSPHLLHTSLYSLPTSLSPLSSSLRLLLTQLYPLPLATAHSSPPTSLIPSLPSAHCPLSSSK